MEQMGKEKGEGVVKNWLLQNGPGDVKDSIGNTVNNTVITVWCPVDNGNIWGNTL